jgi:SAM-dependent methyltransferase
MVPNTPIDETLAAGNRSVAVVITINVNGRAHFLIDALESSLQQTVPPAEIVLIDCGSHEDAEHLAARFPGIIFQRLENVDRFAAQQTALAGISSPFVVFLDVDDRLTRVAIEAGLECFDKDPNASLVCGAHRVIDGQGRPVSPVFRERIVTKSGLPLPGGGDVVIQAAVMYRTDWLRSLICTMGQKGHDAEPHSERTCAVRISSHDSCVAEYRSDKPLMLARSFVALQTGGAPLREISIASRSSAELIFHHTAPQAFARASVELVRNGWNLDSAKVMYNAARMAPIGLFRIVASRCAKAIIRSLPRSIGRLFGEALWAPRIGSVDFGDFGRIKPISIYDGFDRGKPLDRYYIERALQNHGELVRGRVLEVGNRDYTRLFGAERVVCSDVLDIDPTNQMATIVGDLGVIGALPEEAFDCIVLTQTLQYVYNLDNALENLQRALAPGGTLLVTVPGISPIGNGETDIWYWEFTGLSLNTMLSSRFGESNVKVQSYGNVFAAISFLTGLSLAEIGTERLEHMDERYPVTVFACVHKAR